MESTSKPLPLTESEMEVQLAAMQLQITQTLSEVRQSNDLSEQRWRSIEAQQGTNAALLSQIEAHLSRTTEKR